MTEQRSNYHLHLHTRTYTRTHYPSTQPIPRAPWYKEKKHHLGTRTWKKQFGADATKTA
jgi:hypothetical protein